MLKMVRFHNLSTDQARTLVANVQQSAARFSGRTSPPDSHSVFRLWADADRERQNRVAAYAVFDGKAIVGYTMLENIVLGRAQSASVAYGIFTGYERRGYGLQALRQTLKIAEDVHSVTRVEAMIRLDNEASIGLVERCGFTLEGIAEAALYWDGEWLDHLRYVILLGARSVHVRQRLCQQ